VSGTGKPGGTGIHADPYGEKKMKGGKEGEERGEEAEEKGRREGEAG